MKGNNSSGQLKFFHNISIEKQDKQQQQPKPTHTTTLTHAKWRNATSKLLLEVGGENNIRSFFLNSLTQKKCHSLLWSILINTTVISFCQSFCYRNLFFFTCSISSLNLSKQTHKPQRRIISLTHSHSHTFKPNQQDLMKVVIIQRKCKQNNSRNRYRTTRCETCWGKQNKTKTVNKQNLNKQLEQPPILSFRDENDATSSVLSYILVTI